MTEDRRQRRKQWVSGVSGEKRIRTVMSHWSLVIGRAWKCCHWFVVEKVRRLKMRLKASKPSLHKNYNALYNFQHFVAFPAEPVHLKKPSRWPKALIGPPCHGAPGRRR